MRLSAIISTPLRVPRLRTAFTLIELMVAVGIVAVVLTIAIPSIYRMFHPESMSKAQKDLLEALSDARALAILNNTMMELQINPRERTVNIVTGRANESGPGSEVDGVIEEEAPPPPPPSSGSGSSSSFKFSEAITIEGIGINGQDWTEDEVASVHFYPNGTSDEFSIVLLSDRGERRNIFLEVVTGLADVETDPNKFRVR